MEKLNVLFEDNHILAVLKPPNILVQKDITGDVALQDICKDYLKKKYDKPGNVYLGIVHRIDRPASGVVIFAKTSKAAARLSEQFKNHKITKIYYTVTQNIPKIAKQNLKQNIITFKNNKKISVNVELSYSIKKTVDDFALVKVNLITGKKHQIRIQFSDMNTPVLGDLRYGAFKPLSDKSIALFAKKIVFNHPTLKHPISVDSPLPNTYPWNLF